MKQKTTTENRVGNLSTSMPAMKGIPARLAHELAEFKSPYCSLLIPSLSSRSFSTLDGMCRQTCAPKLMSEASSSAT